MSDSIAQRSENQNEQDKAADQNANRERNVSLKSNVSTSSESNKRNRTICTFQIIGIVILGLSILGYSSMNYFQENKMSDPRAFTKEELAKYDGSDPSLPVYVAIKGQVYDVSSRKNMYGKGRAYNGFAGRDATRSFLDNCFTPACLEGVDDLEGLSVEQMKKIDSWAKFFTKYPYVGYVIKTPKEKQHSLNPSS